MKSEAGLISKCLATFLADVGFELGVCGLVFNKVPFLCEVLVANVTAERFQVQVYAPMTDQVMLLAKVFATEVAGESHACLQLSFE